LLEPLLEILIASDPFERLLTERARPILARADAGEDAVVAALAFVKAEARIPARALVAGIPARVLRELSAQEIAWKRDNMQQYQQLAVRSATTMKQVEALTRVEPNRRRIEAPGAVPLSELKAGVRS
jgi:phenylacetic acid degradation protein